jgi:hypothetical protein
MIISNVPDQRRFWPHAFNIMYVHAVILYVKKNILSHLQVKNKHHMMQKQNIHYFWLIGLYGCEQVIE